MRTPPLEGVLSLWSAALCLLLVHTLLGRVTRLVRALGDAHPPTPSSPSGPAGKHGWWLLEPP